MSTITYNERIALAEIANKAMMAVEDQIEAAMKKFTRTDDPIFAGFDHDAIDADPTIQALRAASKSLEDARIAIMSIETE